VTEIPFEIFSVSLNKRQLSQKVASDKNRVYNFISRMCIEKIPFDTKIKKLDFIIDKSKNKSQIGEFNAYILNHLESMLEPTIPINIYHRNFKNDFGLQAADLFSWGIFRKYERSDYQWYDIFKQKISYERVYP